MANDDLVRNAEDLKNIADLMADEISNPKEDIVSRYVRIAIDSADFNGGRKAVRTCVNSNVNKENMSSAVFTTGFVDELTPHNLAEVAVGRDIREQPFNMHRKGVPLPVEEEVFFEPVPSGIDHYDNELREFARSHANCTLSRQLRVQQTVIVNSKGGKVVQSVPFFSISYTHGYEPIPTNRDITVVCTSYDDIRRLPETIKYMPDPTPEGRIRKSDTFSGAFGELHRISGLRFGSLEEAGIPTSELYDVIMLTGVPVHEIFGHHFEEPIRLLEFGECGTFKYGQKIQNKGIVLQDNPFQEVGGFRVNGFTRFDAYGRKREPRMHIKDGEVVGFLGSEYADSSKLKNFINIEKSEFIGNASQYTDGYLPQPRMTCTVLDGSVENMDWEGRLLLVPHGGRTNPLDKTYRVHSYESYIVRGGVPRRIVPLQVTGGINQALSNITLLDGWSYQTGFCYKPDPLEKGGSAQMPVSQFSRNQMWGGQQVYPVPISNTHLRILIQ